MPDKSCLTCKHSTDLYMGSWDPPRNSLRCFRIGRLHNGSPDHHLGVGRTCKFETDSLPEPQRPKGEKCGKKLRHWEAKTDV